MDIGCSERSGVLIAALPGDLGQHDYLEMRQHFRTEYIDAGMHRIIIDCSGLDEAPSIAFGVFCSISRDARRAGGWCCLVRVSPGMREVLARTHADRQVHVYDEIEDALAAELPDM